MNFGRKIIMALMPLFITVGLYSADGKLSFVTSRNNSGVGFRAELSRGRDFRPCSPTPSQADVFREYNDGVIEYISGKIKYPPGTIVYPQGHAKLPSGCIHYPYESLLVEGGAKELPSGFIVLPDLRVKNEYGKFISPKGVRVGESGFLEEQKKSTPSLAASVAAPSIVFDEPLRGPILGGAGAPSVVHTNTTPVDAFIGHNPTPLVADASARETAEHASEKFPPLNREDGSIFGLNDDTAAYYAKMGIDPRAVDPLREGVFVYSETTDLPLPDPEVEPQAATSRFPGISPDDVIDIEPQVSGAEEESVAPKKGVARVPDHRRSPMKGAKFRLAGQRSADAARVHTASPAPKLTASDSAPGAIDVPRASASATPATAQESTKPAAVPGASATPSMPTMPSATPFVPFATPASGSRPQAAHARGFAGGASSSSRYNDAYFSSERRPTYTQSGGAAGSSSGSTRRQIEENIRRIVSRHPHRDDRTYEENEYLGAHRAITDVVIAQMQEEYCARRDARRARGDYDNIHEDLRAVEDERRRREDAARHHSFMMHQHMARREASERYFATVMQPLMEKGVHAISEKDACELSDGLLGALSSVHNGYLPREHYEALVDFDERRRAWKKNYHERLKPSSLKPDDALTEEEKAIFAENPEVARAFREKCKAQDEKNKSLKTAWDARRQNIPLSLPRNERQGLIQYTHYLEDYEKRSFYNFAIDEELQKAVTYFSKPLTTASRSLVQPATASVAFKELLKPVEGYTGTEVGRNIYNAVCTALHQACANSHAYWDERGTFQKIDYAKDLPYEALLLADLAIDATKRHHYISALYAAKALQAYVAFCVDQHVTTYENFGTVGCLIGSFFSTIVSDADTQIRRMSYFAENGIKESIAYNRLSDAVDLFANYLYQLALADEAVKRSILHNEKWVNDANMYQAGNKVRVDFVYKTCHKTPSTKILEKVQEHFGYEDRFCKVDDQVDKGLHRASYLYVNALKQAVVMLKGAAAIPAPVPPVRPAAGAGEAPIPPAGRAADVERDVAEVPVPPVRPATPVEPALQQAEAPTDHPVAAGAGSAHGKKRTAGTTFTIVAEEDNDGADAETDQRARRRPNPAGEDPVAGAGIVMEEVEEGEPQLPAIEHVVSARDFSHVQELYVRCAASAQALSGQLTSLDKHEQASRIRRLSRRIGLLSQEVAQFIQGGAQGITRSAAEAIERAITFGADLRANPGVALCHKAMEMAQHTAISLVTILDLLPTEDMSPEQMRSLSDYHSQMYTSFAALPTIEKGELFGRMIGEYVLFEARLLGAGRVFGAVRGGSSAGSDAVCNFAQSIKASLEAEARLARSLEATPRLAESLTPLTQAMERTGELFAYTETYGFDAQRGLQEFLVHPRCPKECTGVGRALPTPQQLARFSEPAAGASAAGSGRGGAGASAAGESLIEKLRHLGPDFLDQMEAAGGHTLERHVNQTNQALILRAANRNHRQKVTAATAFTNKRIANYTVLENIRNNMLIIEDWLKKGDIGELVVSYEHERAIGFGVVANTKTMNYDLRVSRAVLEPSNATTVGFCIKSAFPII